MKENSDKSLGVEFYLSLLADLSALILEEKVEEKVDLVCIYFNYIFTSSYVSTYHNYEQVWKEQKSFKANLFKKLKRLFSHVFIFYMSVQLYNFLHFLSI